MLLHKFVIIILQCYFTLYVLFFLNSSENAVKGDERITRAVGLCKKLVGHFSHTWKGKMALKKAQKEHNLPEHSLITECPTRWGSRQRMIQRVLEQQRAISDVLSADRKSRHLVPSWQDLDVLESINQALQPLQEFTDALSGERYVSVSYVKPVLHLMNTSILAAKEEDSDLTKSIKMKILEYMNTKYDNPATQELLDMTCFMDPRFKANYISSDKVSDIRARVKSEIEATVPQVNVNMTIISDKIMHYNCFSILGAKPKYSRSPGHGSIRCHPKEGQKIPGQFLQDISSSVIYGTIAHCGS